METKTSVSTLPNPDDSASTMRGQTFSMLEASQRDAMRATRELIGTDMPEKAAQVLTGAALAVSNIASDATDQGNIVTLNTFDLYDQVIDALNKRLAIGDNVELVQRRKTLDGTQAEKIKAFIDETIK